jgi:hypothetical protein
MDFKLSMGNKISGLEKFPKKTFKYKYRERCGYYLQK